MGAEKVTDFIDFSSFSDVLLGKEMYARFPGFLSKNECESIVKNVDKVGIEYYSGDNKNGKQDVKGKLGPNFFRYRFDRNEYNELNRKYSKVFLSEIFEEVNVVEKFKIFLEKTLKLEVKVPTLDGNPFATCTIRDMPGAPKHRDWLPGECPDLLSHRNLIDQFAWNIYLELPETGGETIVYPTAETDTFSDVLQGDTIKPMKGDLVIFRSTNIHEVRPGSSRRLTISGFFGPCRDGSMIIWV